MDWMGNALAPLPHSERPGGWASPGLSYYAFPRFRLGNCGGLHPHGADLSLSDSLRAPSSLLLRKAPQGSIGIVQPVPPPSYRPTARGVAVSIDASEGRPAPGGGKVTQCHLQNNSAGSKEAARIRGVFPNARYPLKFLSKSCFTRHNLYHEGNRFHHRCCRRAFGCLLLLSKKASQDRLGYCHYPGHQSDWSTRGPVADRPGRT